MDGVCKGIGFVGDAANKVVGGLEDAGKTVVGGLEDAGSTVVGGLEDAGGAIGGLFKGRKRRSTTISRKKRAANGCDALKKLDPKKLFNIEETLNGLKPKFKGDIKGIKNKTTGAFKTTVEYIKTIISVCKKIFYLATLLFMMYDGYK